MKHLKLFEQVEDWDDPFGEEVPSVCLNWRIIKHKSFGNYYLIGDDDDNGLITLFNGYDYRSATIDYIYFDINPEIDDETNIEIFEKDHRYGEMWKKCKYKNLPQEIKDKIIN